MIIYNIRRFKETTTESNVQDRTHTSVSYDRDEEVKQECIDRM